MRTTNVSEKDLKNYNLQTSDFGDAQGEAEITKIFGKHCDIIKLYNLSFYDDTYHPDYAYICISYNDYIMVPRKLWSDKGYTLFNVRNEIDGRTAYRNANDSPQKIGVATDKKLSAWVDYLKNENEEQRAYYNDIQKKISAFLSEIEKIDSLSIDKDKGNGRIVKNGIEYTFSIDYRNGYISQKIQIHYGVSDSIESFLKLSNNSYIADKRYQ